MRKKIPKEMQQMQQLQLFTLGGLDMRLSGQPTVKLLSRKVEMLLIYLVANPRPHPRETLSEALWNDQSQENSLAYLRTALANLNKQFAPFLNVTCQTIGINPASAIRLDMTELHTALTAAEQWQKTYHGLSISAAATLEEALSHYHGAFLQGVHFHDASNMEHWIATENTRLNIRLLQAYHTLGEYALTHGIPNMGIPYLKQALEVESWHEESHRLLMRLYYQAGKRSAAIAQYETCRRLLATELHIDPMPETEALYVEICTQTIAIPATYPVLDTVPMPQTPFIERPTVQLALNELMNNPDCRLITLTGLGGVGKTRLAIELALRYQAKYTNGVLYVSLNAPQYADQIYTTLISALKLPLYDILAPEQEIAQYLHEKHTLLVLDNFEHLADGALVLSRLLTHAPMLKVIVTARQRLSLHEEWVYPVQPLLLPTLDAPNAVDFEAVQLFIQSANRANFDYRAELGAVIRICQLVKGLPLAIELAASWTRMLSAEKIVSEISNNIDFLSTPTRNMEERHRSMRAVFNSSWRMLSSTEQQVFSELAVFRSGFSETAAHSVANTDLFILLGLADKSLIQGSEGRYTLHEILRQYAYEKLAADPTALNLTLDRHASYYADLFERYGRLLMQDSQDPIYIEVMRESQNCFLAWDRLVERNNVAAAARLLTPFFKLFDIQSRYAEGERFFRTAVQWLQQQEPPVNELILARAKIMQALRGEVVNRYSESEQLALAVLPIFIERGSHWDTQLAWRCLARNAYARGNYLEAQHYFEQAKALLEVLNEPAPLAGVLLRLSDIAGVLGEYTNARNYLERYAHIFNKPLFRITRVRFLVTLGDIHIKLGNFTEAEGYLAEAHSLCQAADNRLGLSVVNSALGRVRIAQDNLTDAARLFEQSVRLCEALDHDWGKSFALTYLGQVLIRQGDFAMAIQHLQDAWAIATPLKAHWILAMSKRNLSVVYLQRGHLVEARREACAAMREAIQLNAHPLNLEVLIGWAALDVAQSKPERAAQIAMLVLHHPMSEYLTRSAAARLLDDLRVSNANVLVPTLGLNIDALMQSLLAAEE